MTHTEVKTWFVACDGCHKAQHTLIGLDNAIRPPIPAGWVWYEPNDYERAKLLCPPCYANAVAPPPTPDIDPRLVALVTGVDQGHIVEND